MDLQANKIDGVVLPVTNKRISASEWNQLVGSLMEFITQAGLTPDASDNEQLLNAFKAIAEDLAIIGANTNLSNLTSTGEDHFAKKDLSNTSGVDFVTEQYNDGEGNGYRKYKSGAIEQWLLGSNGISTWLTPFPSTKYFATISYCGPSDYSTATTTTPTAGGFGNDVAYSAEILQQGTTQISWGWNARNYQPTKVRIYAIYIPEAA